MQMTENKRPRNSGIELLKLVAMILIVLSHSLLTGEQPVLFNLEAATTDIQRLIAVVLKYGGQLGNAMFLTASAWFLLDSDRTNGQKILRMMGDTFALSVLSLAANIVCGYEISLRIIVSHLLPVTAAHAWFITAYILLYAMHFLLNRALRSLDKRGHLLLCAVLFLLYALVPMVNMDRYWGTFLVWVIVLYVFVAYFKFHLQNIYRKKGFCVGMLTIGLVGLLLSIGFLDVLGLFISGWSRQMLKWNHFLFPPILLIAFGSFGLAKEKQFVNRTVNYLSGMTLLIYLIHDCTFAFNLRVDLFTYINETYTMDLMLLWIVLYGAAQLIVSVLLAAVYRYTLQRLVRFICDKLSVLIGRVYTVFADRLLKWN